MATWTKSSYSGSNEHSDCVEVLLTPQITAVRDSKSSTSGHLTLPAPAWSALLTTLREVPRGVVSVSRG
jgi:hypothetical protein